MINKKYERSNYLRSFLVNSYGKIAEIFRHSLNVEFDNHYLHIGGNERGLTAFGISLPIDETLKIIDDVEIGSRVLFRDGYLVIYGNTKVYKYNLNEFKEVDLKLQKKTVTNRSLEVLLQLLQRMKIDQKIGISNNYISDIKPLLRQFSDGNCKKIVRSLIGRGKGLTPSGDDMLVGMLMILTSVKGQESEKQILKDSLQIPDLGNTTHVSENYLHSAMAGYVSEDLKLLSENLNCNDAERFKEIVQSILLMGHTSGHDTMMGIYLALIIVLGGEKDD